MKLLALGLAAWLAASPASAAVGSNCWGVMSLTPWDEAPKPAILSDSLADGVVVRAYWDSLETSPGTFRWGYLDGVFANAGAKRIHLVVAPGFYSPQAVIQASQTAEFLVQGGPLGGLTAPLPLPWDDTYLHDWFEFVDSLGARYGQQPSLAYVSLTGPTSFDGEMALPSDSASIVQWRAVAGSDTTLERLLEQAWFQTIDAFSAAFPAGNRYFTLALVPNSLPLGDSTLEAQYESDIIAYGTSHAPDRFGLQTNGLDGRPYCPDLPPPYHWPVISQYSGSTLTGFQTKDPPTLYACPPRDSVLYDAVQNAISFDAHFIEIYEANVLDDSLSWVVKLAHQELTGCGTASVPPAPAVGASLHIAPDPFGGETSIRYTLPASGPVDLGVFDLAGARVATLARGGQTEGDHEVSFRGSRLPPGAYFCRLRAGARDLLARLLIVR